MRALYNNTTGNANTANGVNSLYNNTTGSSNTANGGAALYNNISGSYNTASGNSALGLATTGTYNSAFGYQAGNTASGGITNYTAIGYNAGNSGTPASNSIDLGNTSVTLIRAQVSAITAYSDARIKDQVQENVPGLAFISRLRPVTYYLNIHRQHDITYGGRPDTTMWEGKYDIEKIRQSGFIAQEVEKAANEIGYDFNGLHKPTGPTDLYGLGYTDFVVPLVKSVQEQQKMIEAQQRQIDELKKEIELLKKK